MGFYIKDLNILADAAGAVIDLRIVVTGDKIVALSKTPLEDTYYGKERHGIAVGEHGRLGDLDAMYDRLQEALRYCNPDGHTAQRIREMMVEISTTPTVIPADHRSRQSKPTAADAIERLQGIGVLDKNGDIVPEYQHIFVKCQDSEEKT